jgi:hypothetical protein
MIDIAGVAGQAVAALAPALPYLLGRAVDEAGKEFGKDAWTTIQKLWDDLRPRIEARPAANEAAQDVADHPDDVDAQAALRLQLKKMLAEDSALGLEVARVLAEREASESIRVTASGDGSVAVFNATNNTITTNRPR